MTSVRTDCSDEVLAAFQLTSAYIDTQVVLETLKFMQKLGKTSPFADFVAEQTNPDPSTQSDDDLIK